MIFACSLIAVSYWFFTQLYNNILQTVVGEIIETIQSGNFNTGENLVQELQILKANNFIVFASALAMLTAIFTFLIARMSLRPTKQSLGLQKRFISDIAHELRTPLAIVKTSNEVALMDDDLDAKTRDFLKSNIQELDRMSEIINNVLSFNNLVRPKKPEFKEVELEKIIDSVVEKLKFLADKKDISISIKKSPTPNILGNDVALGQVVSNLLKNAIAYTPPGGKVTVRLGRDFYGNAFIHIEDTGMGIAQEDIAHVFEPFYRAERSRNRSNGSSGLGLTIANEIVKMHSGELMLRSEENRGTVASVTLPAGKNFQKSKESEKV